MNKGELAVSFHQQGYNCSQALAMAFAEEMGLSLSQAARVAHALGQGVGAMRETCGAVTGMALVLGGVEGSDKAPTPEEKKAFYARMRRLGDAFRQKHGTVNCLSLLKLASVEDPMPDPEKRPCNELIYDAALLIWEDLHAKDTNP